MKLFKISAIILSAIIFLTATGCSNTVGNIEETDAAETATGTSEITTDTFEHSDCEPILYNFFSVADMHTYITTGSKDLADYSSKQKSPLDDYPSPEYLHDKYLSIQDLLNLDTVALNAFTYASFVDGYGGDVHFNYEMDDIVNISVVYLPDEEIADKDASEYHYFGNYGIISTVWFRCDNFKVTISIYPSLSDDGSKDYVSAYDSFMALPETSAYSPLFSKDGAVRTQAFEAIEANFAEIKNEVK